MSGVRHFDRNTQPRVGVSATTIVKSPPTRPKFKNHDCGDFTRTSNYYVYEVIKTNKRKNDSLVL